MARAPFGAADAALSHLLRGLSRAEHGRWRLAPFAEARGVIRQYQGDTLILETRFKTDQGSVRLIDFMPPRGRNSNLVRMVVGESGTVNMSMELAVRFGYGARVPWISRQEDGTLRIIAGAEQVVLASSAPSGRSRTACCGMAWECATIRRRLRPGSPTAKGPSSPAPSGWSTP
jgi:Domain of unknown function (DUF5911)